MPHDTCELQSLHYSVCTPANSPPPAPPPPPSIPPPSRGWIVGRPGWSCFAACAEIGLACVEADLDAHVYDVDSSAGIVWLLDELGTDSRASACHEQRQYHDTAAPYFTSRACAFAHDASASGLEVGDLGKPHETALSCGATVVAKTAVYSETPSRLCYCSIAPPPPPVRLIGALSLGTSRCLARLSQRSESLAGCDLSYVSLGAFDLSNTNLRGVNLRGADLHMATLQSADLKLAVLDHANLAGANLNGAALEFARMEWVTAAAASFRGADLSRASAAYADLTGSDLTHAVLHGTDLTHAVLIAASLADVVADGTRMTNADLRAANLYKARLVDAAADGARFDDAACGSMRVEESSLLAASFRGAELTGARFDRYTSLEFAMFDQQLEHIPRTDELGVG